MKRFTTSSPKEEILAYLQPISRQIREAMKKALPEAKQAIHSIGLILEPGKTYDRHYFAYTMRVIAKRNLAELGVEAELESEGEDDTALQVRVESAALGGLVLKTAGFVIRILKPDAKLELPRAASESRALFYEQQIPLPFPELESASEEDEKVRDLGIVYLWEVNRDFTHLEWQVALPMNRQGDCFWKVPLDAEDAATGTPAPSPSMPQSRPPLAAIAALGDSDLNYTAKTSTDEEKEEPRSKGASNGT